MGLMFPFSNIDIYMLVCISRILLGFNLSSVEISNLCIVHWTYFLRIRSSRSRIDLKDHIYVRH